MATRIAVVNDEIYRISEAKFQKLRQIKPAYDPTRGAEAEANFIRKWGRKILDADIMVRDD